MRVLVISQCTATKMVLPAPAERFYRGLHHTKLMRGVHAARRDGDEVHVRIISAQYGLVGGDQVLSPYDQTFAAMPARHRAAVFRRLGIVEAVFQEIQNPHYEAVVIALGEAYCEDIPFRKFAYWSPTVRITSDQAIGHRLLYREVDAGQHMTNVFGCGNISLKGEVAARILERGVHRREREFLALDDSIDCLL